MAPTSRRHRQRHRRPPTRRPAPWRRTRAYRLARTCLLTVSLVVGGVWWNQADEEPAPTPAPASGPRAEAGAGEAPQGEREGGGSGGGPGTAAPDTERRTAPAKPSAPVREERIPAAPERPSPGPPRRSPGPPERTAVPARPDRPAGSATPASPARPRATPSPTTPLRPLPRSRATRLLVPYIGVDAPVMNLRLDQEGRLTAPPEDKADLVGWYEGGPSPGEQGTAVVVGHLDTMSGPAVFAGLGELKRGSRVEFRRADGRTAVYDVDAVKSYEKDDFPNDEVYGSRGRPELRLITCGGTYRPRTGYSGNVVVFAHLTEVREPGRGARTP
ncbi:class F sortase [Streptomyces broussonetiae]|uniref:Class F sortase n=1 Tax=Streptomyces broussonetiae TaxID=2686304 RepID=A0ABV5E701_9ACTN